MTNLSHMASFHSKERIAPSNRGIKHLTAMLKIRIKRLGRRKECAVQRLAQIETALCALDDEDLLDLADIFKDRPQNPIGEIAATEMKRRDISL